MHEGIRALLILNIKDEEVQISKSALILVTK